MRKTQRFFTSLAGFLLCLFSLTTWAASSRFKPGPENQSLSQQDVRQIIEAGNFFDKYWNPSGDFANRFEEKNIHQDRIIIDRTSGLMWHPSGSRDFVDFKGAEEWISRLNDKEYAGSSSWRLRIPSTPWHPCRNPSLTLLF